MSLLKPPSIVSTFKGHSDSASVTSADTKTSIPQKNYQIGNGNTPLCTKPDDSQEKDQESLHSNRSGATYTPLQKKSSFNKFSRSSSKKKKGKTSKTETEDPIILNNGRVSESTTSVQSTMPPIRKNENLSQATNRILNDTSKDMNRISPQSSFRQSVASHRRASAMINNSQQQSLLQQYNRQNSIKNHPNMNYRRRMSSIEQVFEKTSNINQCNLENLKAGDSSNSKLSLSHIQKSLSNINEGDQHSEGGSPTPSASADQPSQPPTKIRKLWMLLGKQEFTAEREYYSLYLFSEENKLVYTQTSNQFFITKKTIYFFIHKIFCASPITVTWLDEANF